MEIHHPEKPGSVLQTIADMIWGEYTAEHDCLHRWVPRNKCMTHSNGLRLVASVRQQECPLQAILHSEK